MHMGMQNEFAGFRNQPVMNAAVPLHSITEFRLHIVGTFTVISDIIFIKTKLNTERAICNDRFAHLLLRKLQPVLGYSLSSSERCSKLLQFYHD